MLDILMLHVLRGVVDFRGLIGEPFTFITPHLLDGQYFSINNSDYMVRHCDHTHVMCVVRLIIRVFVVVSKGIGDLTKA